MRTCRSWACPGCRSGGAAWTCPIPTGPRWRPVPRRPPPGSPDRAPAPAAARVHLRHQLQLQHRHPARDDIRAVGVAEIHQVMVELDTSCPVTPSSRLRESGTLPYSSTTGKPLPVFTAPARPDHCPGDASQVSVPSPARSPGTNRVPQRRGHGVSADRSCRVTAAVAGAGARSRPDPDEAGGGETPVRHADTTPASSTTTRPRPPSRHGGRQAVPAQWIWRGVPFMATPTPRQPGACGQHVLACVGLGENCGKCGQSRPC